MTHKDVVSREIYNYFLIFYYNMGRIQLWKAPEKDTQQISIVIVFLNYAT